MIYDLKLFLIIPKTNLMFFYYSLVNQTMSTLDPGQTRRILHEALSVWSKNSKLNFRETLSPDADIQVLFAKWVESYNLKSLKHKT